MYIGHGRLFVCLSLSAFPHYCSDPDVTCWNSRGCPLVYDNTHICKLIALYTANVYSAEREMSARACTCSMPGLLLSVKTLMVVIPLAALLH